MRISRSALASRSGFTLMEIMMALFVLSIVIAVFLWSDQQKWRILDRGSRYKEAIRKIEQKIENKRIGALASDQVPANGATSWTTTDGVTMRDSVGPMLDVFGNTMTNVKSFTVWATWPGGQDTIRISTTIAKDF